MHLHALGTADEASGRTAPAPPDLEFAIYPPAGLRLPWLAVVLIGGKPADVFGCADREAADRLLRDMRMRRLGKAH